MKHFTRYFLLALILVCSVSSWAEIQTVSDFELVTLSKIEAERSVLASSISLSEQQRQETRAKLDEAASLLQQTDIVKVSLQKIQEEIKLAPEKIKKLQEPLKINLLVTKEITTYSSESLKTLLEKLRMELDTSRNNQDEQEKLLASYISLSKSGGADIADINSRLDKLGTAVSEVIIADRLLKMARLQMLNSKYSLLRTKIDNLGVLSELATVQRDHYASQISLLQKNMDQLHQQLQLKAGEEYKSAQQVVDNGSNDVPPELKDLQDNINQLLQAQNKLLAESSIKSQRLDTLKRQLDELKADQD